MVTSFSLEVRARAEPVDRRPAAHLHGLPRAGQRDRRLELQHARRGRSDQSGARHVLPGRRRASTATASSASPKTNAYSGNNGRAAILNDSAAPTSIYTAGNAGNGGNPQPDGVIIGAGAQIIDPEAKALDARRPRVTRRRSAASTSPSSATRPTSRQGHQLPRPDDLQQRRLLHQGQRRQRRQHGLLHRHHRHGLPATASACPAPGASCRPRRSPTTPSQLSDAQGVTPTTCAS